MLDIIKTFGIALIVFVAMGNATLSHACGSNLPDPINIDLDIRP